jgi:hypothetical protein
MERERKRRGPQPRGEFEDKRRTLTTRITDITRQRLEAASRTNGRSLSQEIEWRLERSFEQQGALREAMDLWCGRKLAGLLLLLGHVMRMAGANARTLPTDGMPAYGWDWFSNAYAYDQAVRAAKCAFERYRPDGDPSILPNGEQAVGWSGRGEALTDAVLDAIAAAKDQFELEGEVRARLGVPRPTATRSQQ